MMLMKCVIIPWLLIYYFMFVLQVREPLRQHDRGHLHGSKMVLRGLRVDGFNDGPLHGERFTKVLCHQTYEWTYTVS